MAIRTVKLMGKAFKPEGNATLRISLNGNEVFNGPVPTEAAPLDRNAKRQELATFSLDTSVTGQVPLVIEAISGDLLFSDLESNYVDFEYVKDSNGKAVLVDGAFQVVTQPADFFGPLNYNDASSDGKDNVVVTGNVGAQWRDISAVAGAAQGDWTYFIPDGETLTCDYTIERLLESVPAPGDRV